MAVQQFSLDTIRHFDDGRVWTAFAQDLRRAVLDCRDRPGEKRQRIVTLTVRMAPIPEAGGEGIVIANDVDTQMTSTVAIPNRRTISRPMRMNSQGQLFFSDLTPESPDQTHIDEINPATGKIERDGKAAAAGD